MTDQLSATLRVKVSGGGPVGLSFSLLLADLMGPKVQIVVYDGRWMQDAQQITWKNENQGNARRHQVVTIQSRHFLAFPQSMQEVLFETPGCSHMWPTGPDSVKGLGPINVRIAQFEDRLLALANARQENIKLVPRRFDASTDACSLAQQHILAICEGNRSDTDGTLRHFKSVFGQADDCIFSLQGKPLHDVVLGLRVKSHLPDPAAVLLTVAQNRFLLNTVQGEGFLNMRLTDWEASGFAHLNSGEKISPASIHPVLWERILEGLTLFDIKRQDLTAVMLFRISMVQRPRFTAQLRQPTERTLGTYGFLLGDTANAVHFWPGRGLNSGLASAISLVNCLKYRWRGTPLRDADFLRHEAVMAMLQYRHKSRAWRFMVSTDESGNPMAIKDKIQRGTNRICLTETDRRDDLDTLMNRMTEIRTRLTRRMTDLPSDEFLRAQLSRLSTQTLHVLAVSQAWDVFNAGGEEVDVDSMFDATNRDSNHRH